MLAEAVAAASDYLQSPSVLADQITAAGLTAWFIQKVKCWPQFRWVNEHSDQVNRLVSLTMALITTVGIHWAWEGSAEKGGILTLRLPPAQEFLSLAWRTGGSFIMQELVYRGVIKHEPGQSAVDTVARELEVHKDEVAAKVIAVKQKEE